MRRACLAVLVATLAACAQAPPVADAPVTEAPAAPDRELLPLAAYATDPFVPVNLYFNANQHLDAETAALVEYAAQGLRDSQAFVRVDRGVQRWPITLQAVYRIEAPATGWRARLGMAAEPRRHSLVVEVFEEPESVAVIEVAARSAEPPRVVVDGLLERLLAEVAARKLVPRWSEFKPEPTKKRKKAPPPGRAT